MFGFCVPLLSSEMASPSMLGRPGKGIFMLFPQGEGRCPQLRTLHNDSSLDGVTALRILCLTFIGALIFKAHAGDLQGGLCCGPLRGQRAIHFAPLDPGNRANGRKSQRG